MDLNDKIAMLESELADYKAKDLDAVEAFAAGVEWEKERVKNMSMIRAKRSIEESMEEAYEKNR